jgi:AcrR family transcriptional regulator
MNNNKAEKCNNYHHGNLHDTLIIAAASLIEESGSTDFAMIDAARVAGVSSAAPYRHFKDKDALLEAVCRVAFMALTESAETTATKHPRGSRELIVALGHNYARFVTSHPQFYDLMWGTIGRRAMESPQVNLQSSGFYVLAGAVQDWCESRGISNTDPADLATKLWAMVHGLSGLALSHQLETVLPAVDINSMVGSSCHTFFDGLEKQA